MISFTICLLTLIVGYFVYGRFVERLLGPDAALFMEKHELLHGAPAGRHAKR